jgi:deoxyribodipyrimidine photo-lyase
MDPPDSEILSLTGGDASQSDQLISTLTDKYGLDRSVIPSGKYKASSSEALRILDDFIGHKLESYNIDRNDPNLDGLSCMSPYLHFGQISPLEIVLRIKEAKLENSDGGKAYIEELVVRRELSMNFVNFNPQYDSFDGLPDWCKKTLREHQNDRRTYIYTPEELESAQTHDPYWNAAQMEMVKTGKMHGYMRMYWGKKILEWMETPEKAYQTALYLNDKYEIDGRDPNGYAGVAWCFGKHDRPWTGREIFGNIRYMNDRGLKRKFDADKYAKKIGHYSY